MARAEKLLERMRANPRDWRIGDIVGVCEGFGITCSPPSGGSHYKVRHDRMAEILTIPARRPIKPIYVRHLVRFVDEVRGGTS